VAAATEWRLDSSPRCNRGFNRGIKPAPDGAKEMFGRRDYSFAPAGAFTIVRLKPTARAVGYWRALLRSLGWQLLAVAW